MKVKKTVLGEMDRCYSVTRLPYQGEMCMMIATEPEGECRIYDRSGSLTDVVWNTPGGTMSLVPVPEQNGFLATHRFYSPDNSKQAAIVSAVHTEAGWEIRTLCDLPFVHRFDILTAADGTKYLIACALKSDHEYDGDWRFPGAVFAAALPDDVTAYDEAHQFPLTCLMDGLLKNHGYFRHHEGDADDAIICAENGIFRFFPPMTRDDQWMIRKISDLPASDAALIDLDGDGKEELFVLAPFHGDTVHVCREKDGLYMPVYTCEKHFPFLHAICPGTLAGKPCVYFGYRNGERDLMALSAEEASFRIQVIDHDCGPANCIFFVEDGREKLLAANRETNEIALYEFIMC